MIRQKQFSLSFPCYFKSMVNRKREVGLAGKSCSTALWIFTFGGRVRVRLIGALEPCRHNLIGYHMLNDLSQKQHEAKEVHLHL
jgi:hypothetical protein